MIDTQQYGRALFELAAEQGADEVVLEELAAVERILQAQPEYVQLLDTPALPKKTRAALGAQAFSHLHPMHLNFIQILCEKHAVKQYGACANQYRSLFDQSHGILRATAITAVPISRSQRKALTARLEGLTGKTVVVTNQVDPLVLGGVLLRLDGTQLDASLQARLADLRRSLTNAIV